MTSRRLFAALTLALCSLLAACSGRSGGAQSIPLPLVCSWPFESDGRGITNVATPETHATYWVTPLAASETMVLHGHYPRARFFDITTYATNGSIIGSLPDSGIAPDPGSTNPFAMLATGAGPQNYTITIGGQGSAGSNRLGVGTGALAFVVIRVYLPDSGQDNTGGVGLPTVSLVGANGATRSLPTCPFTSAEVAVGNLIILLATNGFADAAKFLQVIQTAFHQQPSSPGSCILTRPNAGPVALAQSAQGSGFFPNPQATYIAASGLCMRADQVLVVRGRAPVYPDTYSGGSVLRPAFDGSIQLRYWSLCNNFSVEPNPVIACRADVETAIGADGFYTYVLSIDAAPPSWLPTGATWLPWGEAAIAKSVIFREIREQEPPLGADYTPQAAICARSAFVAQGWRGCFAQAQML